MVLQVVACSSWGSRKDPHKRHWPKPVHFGDVVMRRQDAARARVNAAEPLVGDMRVT